MSAVVVVAKPRKIVLDTDPGGDDTFALLWLLSLVKQGLADLVAVTTADGNVAAQRTFTSASQILNLVGFSHVPVGRGGGANPANQEDASHIHGSDGMGNLSHQLPPPTHSFVTAPVADELLIELLTAHPGEITVVAIAPLTNLASAEQKCPGILKQAQEIVVMAGAFQCPGNVTAQAEFNVWFDPPAAEVVMQCSQNLVVIPLDVTRRLVFTSEMAQAVSQRQPQSELARLITELCEFMTGTSLAYRETHGKAGFLVHDAATLAYVFYPETLLFKRGCVRVETQGLWTLGQTLCDRRYAGQASANAWIGMEVDEAALFACLIEDLKTLIGG